MWLSDSNKLRFYNIGWSLSSLSGNWISIGVNPEDAPVTQLVGSMHKHSQNIDSKQSEKVESDIIFVGILDGVDPAASPIRSAEDRVSGGQGVAAANNNTHHEKYNLQLSDFGIAHRDADLYFTTKIGYGYEYEFSDQGIEFSKLSFSLSSVGAFFFSATELHGDSVCVSGNIQYLGLINERKLGSIYASCYSPGVYGIKRCIDMIRGEESDLAMAEYMIFNTVDDIMDKNDFADIYRGGFFSDAFAEHILKYVSTHKDEVQNGITDDGVNSTISHMLGEIIVNLIEKELDHKKLNKDIEELFLEKNDNFGVSRHLDPNLDRTKLFHIERECIKQTSIEEALTIHDMKNIINFNQVAPPAPLDGSAVSTTIGYSNFSPLIVQQYAALAIHYSKILMRRLQCVSYMLAFIRFYFI